MSDTTNGPIVKLYNIVVREVVEHQLLGGLLKITHIQKTKSIGTELHIQADTRLTAIFVNGKRVSL